MGSFIHADSIAEKLEIRLPFKPKRSEFTFEGILAKLTRETEVKFILDTKVEELAHHEVKKFSYPNTRSKYILYRMLKEFDLKYKVEDKHILIYKDSIREDRSSLDQVKRS